MKNLNISQITNDLITWTRNSFNNLGPETKAVIGISGGKDSTICAAILVKALGRERVVGVLLPNGDQSDISDSYEVCKTLGIRPHLVNIESAIKGLYQSLTMDVFQLNSLCTINTPPRIRMTTLYAIAGCVGGLVVNTSNLSESYVGYFTKNGDNRGDIALLKNFTKSEVVKIGHELGLPMHLIEKAPSDGLSGKTDEDNLGFTYAELDDYLRNPCDSEISPEVIAKIEQKHRSSLHKLRDIPTFKF